MEVGEGQVRRAPQRDRNVITHDIHPENNGKKGLATWGAGLESERLNRFLG